MQYGRNFNPIYWARNNVVEDSGTPIPPNPLPVLSGLEFFVASLYNNLPVNSLVTKNGLDRVSNWLPLESTTHEADQTILTRQPTYVVPAGAGEVAHLFNDAAIDNYMVVQDTAWFANLKSFTCFVVFEPLLIPASTSNLFGALWNNPAWTMGLNSGGTVQATFFNGGTSGGGSSTVPLPLNERTLAMVRFSDLADGGNGTIEIYIKGVLDRTFGFALTPNFAGSGASVSIGAHVNSAQTSFSNVLQANFYTVGVYNRALTSTEITDVSNYLMSVYNITLPPPPLPVTSGLEMFVATKYQLKPQASLIQVDAFNDVLIDWLPQEGTSVSVLPPAAPFFLNNPLFVPAVGATPGYLAFRTPPDSPTEEGAFVQPQLWYDNLKSHTLFVVYTPTRLPPIKNQIFGTLNTGGTTNWDISLTPSAFVEYTLTNLGNATTSITSSSPLSIGTRYIITARFSDLADGGDGSCELYLDGVIAGTGTFSLTPSIGGPVLPSVGSIVELNQINGQNLGSSRFYSIIAYNRALTPLEISDVVNFLTTTFS